MREQLIQYVNLLFAGTDNCEDIKQEILQNTLDRYDDLIAEGRVPEAAYRLAISGIGDINEILGTMHPHTPSNPRQNNCTAAEDADEGKKRKMRAIAIGIYIVAAIPLIALDTVGHTIWGLSLTLLLVAIATVLLIQNVSKKPEEEEPRQTVGNSPKSQLEKSISNLIWAVGLVAYLLISFMTQAWYITWLIFPIIGAAQGLVKAILDLKEAVKNEN